MMGETDTSAERKLFYKNQAETVINNLQKRHINGQYVSTRQEALSAVMGMIPPGAVVARGDSVSLNQIGIMEELLKRNQNTVIDQFKRNADGSRAIGIKDQEKVMREAFFADIFLTGTNAVTIDGKLVNIDGMGNRVSAMIFGPGKVVVVAGSNKIVTDVNAALDRIHNVAAPLNACRHYVEHPDKENTNPPCVKSGSCIDCRHDWRMCNYTVIIEGAVFFNQGRINVVLVGEELGL